MKTVLLAGGLGTRLSEETVVKPKPMVEIGGMPILWHIMSGYAAHGFGDFLVACGYKGSYIKDYFVRYREARADVKVNLSTGIVSYDHTVDVDWDVEMVDTGTETMTGGRLGRLRSRLVDGGTFFLTYGDGVCDVDIRKLLAFHRAHGRQATMTAVRPPARFGTMEFDGEQVISFKEKPQTEGGWINGGFFVFEPAVFDFIAGDATILEAEPLESLAASGQLMAYKHEGFWQCMDTVRDKSRLEEMWQSGQAPWKKW